MGALTSKLYSFQARPWELKREKGIDPYEGKEVLFELRGLEVLRVLPQGGWISDKIRMVIDSFQCNRLFLSKKYSYQRGVWREVSLSTLGRTFSLLFLREESHVLEKREFFFPHFFSKWGDPKTSGTFFVERRGNSKWNYITY